MFAYITDCTVFETCNKETSVIFGCASGYR